MSKSTSRKSVIGLDIEPGYVTAAEVRVNAGITVAHAATASLHPGVVRDGEVMDAESLAETLKQLFREHKLDKRVRLGVASPRIVVRTLDLPPLKDPKELAAAVRFKAPEQVPMPLDQAVLDYQTLGEVETTEGLRTRVLVVAARRDMIDRLLTAVRRAGLRPLGIDLSAFAMIRALYDPSPEAGDGVVLYIAAGGLTNLAVADGSRCLFTRVASSGVESMVTQLAERRELTVDHARQWLGHVGLTTPLDEIDGDPQIVSEARNVLGEGARKIADDIRNSLEFYAAQGDGRPVERAVITGPGASINGFVDELSRLLGLPVDSRGVAEARPGALGSLDGARLSVAAGLAVTEVSG
jgi:type IV pilus assembly protein PilM